MSKQNQLNNRLNDLFADMGEEESAQIADDGQNISGWNWQCDAVGYYTACSPEVEEILGLQASIFLGKLFTTFQLSPESSEALLAALEDGGNEAVEITLEYQKQAGGTIPTLTKIFRQDSNAGQITGWQGFSQVIQLGTKPLSPDSLDKPTPGPHKSSPETRRRLATDAFGLALENDETITVSSPYSGAGKQSLKQRQSVSYPSAPGIEAALAVPIHLADESLGLLEVIDSSPDRQWNQDEQLLVEEVANQLSLALENAQLFQETQFSLARTEALFQVGQAAIAFDDLNELLQSVANTITKVLPADRTLMVVCDQQRKELTHFLQSHKGVLPIEDDTYSQLMDGLTGWAIREQKPALSNERTDDLRESKAARAIRQDTDAGSVLVVPMIYRDDVFGTITSINTFAQAKFTQADLDLLMAMANQVATALANSQLFQQVTARSEELALINRIVTKITGTLDINEALQSITTEIGQALYTRSNIGLFDKTKTELDTVAFHSPVPNVPDLVGTVFDTEQAFGVAADITIIKPVIFDNVQHDPNLSLNHAKYRENNIFSFATFPISIGGEVVGLLTVDIIERGRSFSDEETRLIQAIITQTSTAIQSANLFQAEQRRRRIAATLSEIARVIGGSLDLEQIAERLLVQLTNVVEFDAASLQIVDGDRRENIGRINEEQGDSEKIRALLYRPISEDPLIHSVVESQRPLVIADTHAEPRWEHLPENSHIRSWIATPLLRGNEVIGLLILDKESPGAFDEETADLLSGIAAQAAVAIHNARLYQQAQARSAQLQTAAEVSRAASSILDPNPLIEQTVNLIRDRFDLYYVGLFLIDETGTVTREPGRWAVLRAGTGDAGRIQVERAHKLEVGGTSMIGQCISTNQPQISQQVSAEEQRFVNPLLPDTRSEMALPLISRGQVTGAMSIQSTEPAAFSEEDITILQTMADQVANALQNASLFDQTQIRAEELAVLNEMSRQLTSTVDVAAITRNLYLFTSRLIDTSTFFIALYDDKTDSLTFPFATEENQEIKVSGNVQSQGVTKYVIDSREPVLISENIDAWLKDHDMDTVLVGDEDIQTAQSWLGVPMLAGEDVTGIINVQHSNPHHYGEQEFDLLVAIASQGAIAFQNASLFAETQQRTEDLALLNEMSAVLSNALDIDLVINIIHEYTSKFMDTYNLFVALYDAETNDMSFALNISRGELVQTEARKLGDGMTAYMIHNRRSLLLNGDVSAQMEARGIAFMVLGDGDLPQSFLGAPMIIGNQAIGAIALQSTETPYLYQERHRDLLVSIAGQAAIAIQNTNLFDETRQRTEDLAILNEMSREMASLLDIDIVFSTAHNYTAKLMDTTNFFIALFDPQTEVIELPFVILKNERVEVSTRPLGTGISDYVIRKKQPLLLNGDDILRQEKDLGIERVAIGEGLPPLSWLGVPMMIGKDAIGVLNVQSVTTAYLYQDRHRDLLISIASQLAITIQNTRLFDQTQRQLADLTNIQQTTTELSAALNAQDVVSTLLENLVSAVHADTVSFFSLQGNNLVRIGLYPKPEDENEIEITISLDDYPLTKNAIDSRTSSSIAADDPSLQEHARAAFKANGISANMTVPLIGPAGALGSLSLNRKIPAPLFNQQEVNLIDTLASQAAISLQNANLFEQIQQRSEELQLINQVVSQVAASRDFTESLQIIADEIGKIARADSVGVALLNEEQTSLVVMADYISTPTIPSAVGFELPLEDNPSSQMIIDTRKRMMIADPKNSPLTKSIHEPMRLRGIETILLLPLIVSGKVIGTVGIDIAEKNRTFTESEIDLVETIVLQAATAIENTRLFEQTQQQLINLTIIQETTSRLSETLNMDDVAQTVLAQTAQAAQADSGNLYILKDDTLIHMGTFPPTEAQEQNIGRTLQLDDLPITKMVVTSREASVTLTDDPSLQESSRESFRDAGIAVNANIPMIGPEGVVGLLTLNKLAPAQMFTPEEINLVTTLANQAAAALENARLYQELHETAEQLREVDTLKSQFLANMSHELRTPLNSIIGFSRVIMKGIDGPVTDLQQQDLSAIYNAGQHLLNMINDILDISKIEAGKMELAFDDVDLTEIVGSVLSTARGLVKDKAVKLITAVDEDIPIITADPTRVRQILLNLISNSAKFTDEGSITVTVREQSNDTGGQEIYLAVTDTGTGIAEEDQHKLFVPFSQVDGSPTRKVEGTGLGLSITRLLIDLHGGDIGVISAPGEGSTFWFTLPLSEGAAQSDSDGNLTVLAIDDDAQVINLYERYLTSAGFQVIPITDPREALEEARNIKPFAITLDIMMPDFDGWQLLEDLKADPEVGSIPVVICSILAEHEKGVRLGATDYLTKPILEDDLIHSLDKLREDS